MENQLTKRILWALLLGGLAGLMLHGTDLAWVQVWLIDGLLLVIGKWFVALLMLMVVPLVFVSLVNGVASLGSRSGLGRLSIWTLTLYVFTTLIAIATGLGLAVLLEPDLGLSLSATQTPAPPAPNMVELLISMMPSNPIAAMAQGNMLQVIIFAVLFGLALSSLQHESSISSFMVWLEGLEQIFIRMVGLVMWLAPIGVFALMARSIAGLGLDLMMPLLWYFVAVLLALLIHAVFTYAFLFNVFTGLSPWAVYRRLKQVLTVAFSTSSSAATLPVTLTTMTRLGVAPQVSSFTIPLGATINMDGTAIMQGVATVFIANAYGLSLAPSDYALVMLTATLASIGTAAVPGAGLIMLTMVLMQVGLPVEGIALILGVDRLLDMLRTCVNVTGDIMVSTIVAQKVGALDELMLLSEPSHESGSSTSHK